MKTLHFQLSKADQGRVEADVEDRIKALFARFPALCGFAVQDRASLPATIDGAIPDADLYVTEIGIFPRISADQYGDIYDEITVAISDLVHHQPKAYDLLRGRTFARTLH
jgi:hypothetical protein